MVDQIAVRGHNYSIHALDRQSLARCRGHAFGSADRGLIFAVQMIARIAVLAIWSVVNERLDRNLLHQLRHASDVVCVVMRDQNVINLLDLGQFRCRGDAISVSVCVVAPTRVDEK